MNITGKFLKVWKVEEKSGYKFLDIGDGEKQKDGTRKFFTWFGCILLGEAASKNFNEGDLVEITSAMITMEKYNDKWSPKIKIFHIHNIDENGERMDATASAAPKPAASPFEKKPEKSEAKPWGQFTPSKPGEQSGGAGSFDDDIPF